MYVAVVLLSVATSLKVVRNAFVINTLKGEYDGSTTLDQKRIYANPSSYPNLSPNPNSSNPKAQ